MYAEVESRSKISVNCSSLFFFSDIVAGTVIFHNFPSSPADVKLRGMTFQP